MAGVFDPGTNLLFLAQRGGPETKTACSRSVPCWWRAPRRQTEDVFCVNSDVTSWKKKTHQRSENSRLLNLNSSKKSFKIKSVATFFCHLVFFFSLMLCVSFIVHVFFFLEPPTFLQVGRWSIWSGATCPCLMEHQSLPTLQEVASTLLVTSGKVGTEATIYFAANKKEIPKKVFFLVRYLSIEYTYTYYLNIYIYHINIIIRLTGLWCIYLSRRTHMFFLQGYESTQNESQKTRLQFMMNLPILSTVFFITQLFFRPQWKFFFLELPQWKFEVIRGRISHRSSPFAMVRVISQFVSYALVM